VYFNQKFYFRSSVLFLPQRKYRLAEEENLQEQFAGEHYHRNPEQ